MTPPAMSSLDTSADVHCPNCHQFMKAQDLEKHDHGTVRVYLCFDCSGLWFDHLASLQLAPGAVIELFKEISARGESPRQSLSNEMNCVRCGEPLTLSHDLCKSGRFTYYSCRRGDGRFTPFFQFLREKQFVRTLTLAEIARVRAQVKQITCSECGAPIDLDRDTQCTYCHAPISFLDPDAVQKAATIWSEADHRRHLAPTPEALGDALLRTQLHRTDPPEVRPGDIGDRLLMAFKDTHSGGGLGPDLVSWGIHSIGRLFGSD
jgi:hypothetical protein